MPPSFSPESKAASTDASTAASTGSARHFSHAFRRLAWSNLLAQSAEQVSLAAAALVAVFVLHAGPSATSLLQTVQTLPFLLLSLVLGVWADRHSRRALMAGAECLRATAMLAVVALLQLHLLNLPVLATIGFLAATATVAYNVAAPALVSVIVARDALAAANGRLELGRSIAYSAGPALGGLLVGWIGAGWAYGLAAGLSLAALTLLRGLPAAQPAPAVRRRFVAELAEGAGFTLRHALLRPVLLTTVFFNLGYFLLQGIYAAYAADRLAMSAAGVGTSLAVYGVGMIVGILCLPWLQRRLDFGRLLTIGPVCGFVASLCMVATIWFAHKWLAWAGFFLFGAGPVLWAICATTLRQTVTAQSMLGRVSAVMGTAAYGARPVGTLLGAVAAAALGVNACLLLSAAAFLVQLLIVLRSPLARLMAVPDMSEQPAAHPH